MFLNNPVIITFRVIHTEATDSTHINAGFILAFYVKKIIINKVSLNAAKLHNAVLF